MPTPAGANSSIGLAILVSLGALSSVGPLASQVILLVGHDVEVVGIDAAPHPACVVELEWLLWQGAMRKVVRHSMSKPILPPEGSQPVPT